MATPIRYIFLAQFGNGIYAKSIRIFTSKEKCLEYLKIKHQETKERIQKQYTHNVGYPEYAEKWNDFEYFLRMIGYKYYIGNLNELYTGDDVVKNISTNKFFSWLTNYEPL